MTYEENDQPEHTGPKLLNGSPVLTDHQDYGFLGLKRWGAFWEQLVNRADLDFEERRKRRLFSILIIPGIIILFSFAFYHLWHGNIAEGILDLIAGLWLVFSLICFRVVENGIYLFRINGVLLCCLFLFLIIKGGVDGNKSMWAFSFPLITLYTLGKKEGLILTAILYSLATTILYVPQSLVSVYEYTHEFKIRFCVVFFLVTSMTYIYESVRQYTQTKLEGERNKLVVEKSKLAELSHSLQNANRALTISEDHMRRAQGIAHVGNLELTPSSKMIWGSEEALKILGIDSPKADFHLSLIAKIVDDFSALSRDFIKCIRDNKEYDRELTIHRLSDGQPAILRAKAEIVRDRDGRAAKIIGVIQDITAQKEVEHSKRQLEEKLAHSSKMESLGLLAGGVAHDLNNVLSGIVSYPDLLLKDLAADSPLTKPLQRIQDSGQKAAAIVQDLLVLARRGVSNQIVLNLNDLINEYMASPEHADIQSWHKDVTFDIHLDPELLNIKGSTVHLKKTITNLASNAAEALPAGGSVEISTENLCIEAAMQESGEIPEGDYAVLRVRDNGIGISSEDLDRIFEPFYTKKKMGRSGTGLGMSVVWGTVEDHRGYIQVISSEGAGTQIIIYFPTVYESVVEPECIVPLDDYVGAGETILVVDDVLEQRELAHRMLTKIGYNVYVVDSGEAALDFLKNEQVDLLLLDMIMDPGIDGLDTYIKILEDHPTQRAIIVSGFSETERVREAQRLGAGIYVKKPYTLEKLGMAVREALQ